MGNAQAGFNAASSHVPRPCHDLGVHSVPPERFPTGYENTLGTVFTLGMRQNLPRGVRVELLCLVTDYLGTQG